MPIAAAQSLLLEEVQKHDVLCQSFHSELLTPISKEVLRYLMQPTHVQRREFPGVRPRDFNLIEHAVGKTNQILTKPRLSYDYDRCLLIVNMPTILLETFFDHLRDAMAAYMMLLPYNRTLICPTFHMNYPLKLRNSKVYPELTMTLAAVDGAPRVVMVPIVGECGSSEDRLHIFNKVEAEIFAHPETVLAIIVLAREAIDYQGPGDISTASRLLRNGRHNPEPLSLDAFLQLRSTPRLFNQPITIANHNWAHLESMECFVWVKGDNQAHIDVRSIDPQIMAHGTLGPVLQMDTVTAMLEKGMSKIKANMVDFSKVLDNTQDFSALEEAEVRMPLDWTLSAKYALTAVDLTAYQRYEDWHGARFNRMEPNNDPSYRPSESDDGSTIVLSNNTYTLNSNT